MALSDRFFPGTPRLYLEFTVAQEKVEMVIRVVNHKKKNYTLLTRVNWVVPSRLINVLHLLILP